MKKTGIAVAVLGFMAIAGSAMAWNGNGHHGGHRNGGYHNGSYHNGGMMMSQNVDPAVRDAFFKATETLRIQYNGLAAEYQAVMNRENPDARRARELGEAMARIRFELRDKAEEAGIRPGYGYGHGGHGGMHANRCW